MFSYDASSEDRKGPTLGRLVNHGYGDESNAKMRVVTVDAKTPILCLFATKHIEENQEVLYDYGQKDYAWEKKVTTVKSTEIISLTYSTKGLMVIVIYRITSNVFQNKLLKKYVA